MSLKYRLLPQMDLWWPHHREGLYLLPLDHWYCVSFPLIPVMVQSYRGFWPGSQLDPPDPCLLPFPCGLHLLCSLLSLHGQVQGDIFEFIYDW